MQRLVLCSLLLHSMLISNIFAFVIPSSSRIGIDGQTRNNRMTTERRMMILPETATTVTSSILTSVVEVFDGSTVVDPVVVSDVFWSSLQSKIIAVIIGQFLATIVFLALSSFFASQVLQLTNVITDTLKSTIFPDNDDAGSASSSSSSPRTTTGARKRFVRADEVTSATKITPDFGKLLICLVVDVLGSSSELVPILGEVTDVVYAPIAATILRSLYGGSNVIFALEFAEEILPFTDILPLATLCWVVDTFFFESDLAKLLQLGIYGPSNFSVGSIDVKAESIQEERLLPEKNKKDRR